jgi:hypothetical protein
MEATPVETLYKGYRFRSRLEARWAVFFDEMRVPYRYELEGFDLGDTWYLPDFWLPDGIRFFDEREARANVWIEVKPKVELAEQDRHKIAEFVKQTGYHLILLSGEPGLDASVRFIAYDKDNLKWWAPMVQWVEMSGQQLGLMRQDSLDDVPGDESRGALARLKETRMLISAYNAARQARFDRGNGQQTAPDTRVTRQCEGCGTTFVPDQPYFRFCGDCYRRQRVDKLAAEPQSESMVVSDSPLMAPETPTMAKTIHRRRRWVAIIAAVVLVVALGIGLMVTRERGADAESPAAVPTSPASRSTGIQSEPCGCSSNLYNCGDFSTRQEAQSCLDYCTPTQGDIHFLDRDEDGLVCETLP